MLVSKLSPLVFLRLRFSNVYCYFVPTYNYNTNKYDTLTKFIVTGTAWYQLSEKLGQYQLSAVATKSDSQVSVKCHLLL